MEDKRIRRTKHELREALLKLLDDRPFERISVTELCGKANVSRITFYTHYGNKYDLVNEYFGDMKAKAAEELKTLQAENNPEDEPAQGFCNMFDAIIDLYLENYNFFRHITSPDNQYLFFLFFRYLLDSVETFAMRYRDELTPRYSLRKTASFLCIGMWGFVHAGTFENADRERTRAEAKELLADMLRGGILSNPA